MATAVATVVGTLAVAAAVWHSSDGTSGKERDRSTALEVVEPSNQATEETTGSTTTPPSPPSPAPGAVSATAAPQRSAQGRPADSEEAGEPSGTTGPANQSGGSAPTAPPATRTPVPPTTATPPTKPTEVPTPHPVLRRGDRGGAVNDVQSRLSRIGLYDGPIDGRYNGPVSRAVGAFQDRYGITGDERGVYGPATRAALEART
ncbi:peptidoglycan-binding domain-containing protein [Streptomyces sp. SP18CS02]|uniref:peptidoglycan-binding domain-containing protein n=1 Tax=Streptomyces sp. SP18CS02 TaxID=3002531 RepID=UPI003FCD5E09